MDAENLMVLKDSMSGLMGENIPVVEQKLIKLGLSVGPLAAIAG